MIESFEQALAWLAKLQHFGIKLGLEQTRTLCDLCGAPDRGLHFIHLAGTNGKGSTGAMLERALRAQNLTTGFYSSPHLISACERFRINGRAVSCEEFTRAADVVARAVETMQQQGASPTYFEATTAMALLIFSWHQCDYVVWETGMGGRLDSTNIVTPEVSIITNIALDHEKYLGSTLAEIAAEKAGIIKPAVPVVCGSMASEVLEVIKARAMQLNAPVIEAEKFSPLHEKIQPQTVLGFQQFSCGGDIVELQLNGVMQQRNAQIAVSALKVLQKWNSVALEALKQVRWPGRMALIGNGRFLLDGGHNPDGLSALCETLQTLYPGRKFKWVFGAFADKDYTGGLKLIAPLAESLDAAAFAEGSRLSAAPEDICCKARELNIKNTACIKDLAAYLNQAMQEMADQDDLPTVIAGSLYLAGEVLSVIETPESVLNL